MMRYDDIPETVISGMLCMWLNGESNNVEMLLCKYYVCVFEQDVKRGIFDSVYYYILNNFTYAGLKPWWRIVFLHKDRCIRSMLI